jgi:hypothetical protein
MILVNVWRPAVAGHSARAAESLTSPMIARGHFPRRFAHVIARRLRSPKCVRDHPMDWTSGRSQPPYQLVAR